MVQSREVHRNFRGSACDSLAGRPSSCEKHLENFSQFCLWVFWQLDLVTYWRLTSVAKNKCLAKIGSVFKSFQFSLEPFMTIHFLSQLNLTQTLPVILYKLHCWTCTPQNLQEEKVWAFILSPHISYFELHFREYLCWCFDFCYGCVLMILGLFLFGLFKVLFPCKLISIDGFIYFLVFVFLIWLPDLCLMYNLIMVSFTHSAWT